METADYKWIGIMYVIFASKERKTNRSQISCLRYSWDSYDHGTIRFWMV